MNTPKTPPLAHCVHQSLTAYFNDLDGVPTEGLYDLVMREVERPLLRQVMQHVEGNQLKAAKLLGLNRNTLRKKLTAHRLR